MLDLGGGSMQLVRVAARLAETSGSWRLGTVRMSERFLPPNGPAKRKQLQELREHVEAELAGTDWLADAGRGEGGRLVGIGGTVRNLAAAAQRAAGLPSNGVQGMVIEAATLDELIDRLAALPAAERAERSRHQAGPRRPDPGGRRRRPRGAASRRLLGSGDDRGRTARGRLLRAAAG